MGKRSARPSFVLSAISILARPDPKLSVRTAGRISPESGAGPVAGWGRNASEQTTPPDKANGVAGTAIDFAAGGPVNLHTVRGEVSAEEIFQRIEEYSAEKITPRVIWDFSDAIIEDSSNEKLRSVLAAASKYNELRKGGKAALVSSEKFLFGLARMYGTLGEIKKSPVEHRAFRTMKDAREWIGKPHPD